MTEPSFEMVMALAHAVDPALHMLNVVAHQPVQGEAMHKVIGYHAAKNALTQVGWQDVNGVLHPYDKERDEPTDGFAPVFRVIDPGPYHP